MHNVYDESDYLAHYGVLGMKWGVRHDAPKAYSKASEKAKSYQKKIDRYTNRANKHFARGVSRSGGLFGSEKAAAPSFRRASRNSRLALRAAQRGAKWIKRMEKEFAKQNAVTMDSDLIKLGQSYQNRVTTAADQMYLKYI